MDKIPENDPLADKTKKICETIINLTRTEAERAIRSSYAQVFAGIGSMILPASIYFLSNRVASVSSGSMNLDFSVLTAPTSTTEIAAVVAFYASAFMIFGYSFLSSGLPRLKKADK